MKTILTAILLITALPAFADNRPAADKNTTWEVWVFKSVDGRWIKQDDRSFKTGDPKQASDYYNAVFRVPGWYATSNAPGCTPPAMVDTERASADARFISAVVDNANLTFRGPLEYSSNPNDPVNGYNTLHRAGTTNETTTYCGPFRSYQNSYWGGVYHYRQ
jgi:hypothetical protein